VARGDVAQIVAGDEMGQARTPIRTSHPSRATHL
jgi:hypothetical protein